MSRSEARELLMKLLFEMEARNDYGESIKSRVFGENMKNGEQEEYLETMYGLMVEHLPAVDELIEKCSENWKIKRISKVDLAVIRTAVLEVMYVEDIPDAVSANEAVDIAKKYGTNDSGRFVNGILGKVIRIKNEN